MSLISRLDSVLQDRVPARPLGLVRVAIGAAAAVRALEGLRIFARLTQPDVLRLPYAEWSPEPTMGWAVALFSIWFVAAVAFGVGWRTRWAGLALAGAIASVLWFDQQTYSNHLYLMLLLVVLLAVGDAGRAVSWDARSRPASWVPAAPVALMKSQISIVYVFAALTKVNDGFLSGGVLAAQLGTGIVPFPDSLRTPTVLSAAATLVVLAELFLAVGLWLPTLRPGAFVVGLGFHTAIALFMAPTVQLLVFGVAMLAVYLLFLDAEPGSRRVVFDDRCSFCYRTVVGLRTLDWLRVHQYVPGTKASDSGPVFAESGIYDEEGDSGFAALRRVAEFVPLTFLVAPVFRLRVIESIGDGVWRAIARRRSCASVRTESV